MKHIPYRKIRIALTATALFSQAVAVSFAVPAQAETAAKDPRVLLIHSTGEYGGFKAADEFDADFKALAIEAGKVPVGDLEAAKLEGNDLVITSSMLLRTARKTEWWESADHLSFAKQGEKLFQYVNNGGTLMVTDALEWGGEFSLNGLAPGLAVPITQCDNGLLSTYSENPIASSPHRLERYQVNYNPFLICRRAAGKFSWGHFKSAPRGWSIVARCADGKPVLLSRPLGKGTLIVTTLCAGRGVDAGLLENVLSYARKAEAAAARRLPDSFFRVKATAPRGESPFDAQGNIIVDGKPFFPVGLYAVANSSYPLVATSGFNSIYGIDPVEGAKYGLKGTAGTSWDLNIARTQTFEHKDSKVFLTQQLFEEPGNLPVPPFTSNYIRQADDVVKEIVPNRPTFVLVNNPQEFPAFGTIGDMAACDPYPFEKPDSPATRPGRDIDYLRRLAGKPNLPVWAVLQAHWFGEAGKRTYLEKPTPDQLLAQTYVALVHRANGLFYFAFDDLDDNKSISVIHRKDGTFDEPLWSALKQVAAEIKTLNPALLSPLPPQDARAVSPGNKIQSLLRQAGRKRYLMVVNPYAHPVQARLKFEGENAPREVFGLFGRDAVRVNENEAAVRFAPYEREVYIY